MKERLVKSKEIYSGKILNFYLDKVCLPNGTIAQREYIRQPQAAAVIPLIEKESVVLVKQYRYPVNRVTYEIPAGKIERGERAADCVRRELAEEAGFASKKIEKLISFYPSTAFSTEKLHIFVARDLTRVPRKPDEDEFVEPFIVTCRKALEWIIEGKLNDAKTVIGLLYYFRKFLS